MPCLCLLVSNGRFEPSSGAGACHGKPGRSLSLRRALADRAAGRRRARHPLPRAAARNRLAGRSSGRACAVEGWRHRAVSRPGGAPLARRQRPSACGGDRHHARPPGGTDGCGRPAVHRRVVRAVLHPRVILATAAAASAGTPGCPQRAGRPVRCAWPGCTGIRGRLAPGQADRVNARRATVFRVKRCEANRPNACPTWRWH